MTVACLVQHNPDRDETIRRVRSALRRRSGRAWSVTGGRGTAWGWITVDAPPAARTAVWVKYPNAPDYPESYFETDTREPGCGHAPEHLRRELAALLGLDNVHIQGWTIPAGSDYRRDAIKRAETGSSDENPTPYWD